MIPDFNTPQMLEAFEAMENQNYSVALELLLPLAEAGNPKAQLNLATVYDLGLGVARNGKKQSICI